jgi:hypothetical protein
MEVAAVSAMAAAVVSFEKVRMFALPAIQGLNEQGLSIVSGSCIFRSSKKPFPDLRLSRRSEGLPTGAKMQKLLLIVAAFGVPAPVLAQTAPSADNQVQAAPAEAPQTVKKTVCRDIDEERSIGSRLHSTTKICKVVEVPAPKAKNSTQPNQAGSR